MGLTNLIVNGESFVMNTESKSFEKTCNDIISTFPDDSVIEFKEVELKDLL